MNSQDLRKTGEGGRLKYAAIILLALVSSAGLLLSLPTTQSEPGATVVVCNISEGIDKSYPSTILTDEFDPSIHSRNISLCD